MPINSKDGHYIMIKGSIQEEDITIINIYAPNVGAPQYVRQMLTSMKGEINNKTIIVGDFNTPLTPMDRSTKQKINKETQTLNDTIDQLRIPKGTFLSSGIKCYLSQSIPVHVPSMFSRPVAFVNSRGYNMLGTCW